MGGFQIVAATFLALATTAVQAQQALDSALPSGWGNSTRGIFTFKSHCSSCHSERESFDPFYKTGTCFVDATRLFNYVKQTMPPSAAPGSLKDSDIYDVVAFVLFEKQLIGRNAIMNATTLPKVAMPNPGYISAGCPVVAGGLGKFNIKKDSPATVPVPPPAAAAAPIPPPAEPKPARAATKSPTKPTPNQGRTAP